MTLTEAHESGRKYRRKGESHYYRCRDTEIRPKTQDPHFLRIPVPAKPPQTGPGRYGPAPVQDLSGRHSEQPHGTIDLLYPFRFWRFSVL